MELIDPLNEAEKELLQSVDDAFRQIIQANSVITAHLNSLREIKELQDDILKRVSLDDLRDNVSNSLDDASKRADEVMEKLKN